MPSFRLRCQAPTFFRQVQLPAARAGRGGGGGAGGLGAHRGAHHQAVPLQASPHNHRSARALELCIGRTAPIVSLVKDDFYVRIRGLEKHAEQVTAQRAAFALVPCFVHRVDAKAPLFSEGTLFLNSSVSNGIAVETKERRVPYFLYRHVTAPFLNQKLDQYVCITYTCKCQHSLCLFY